MDSTAKKRGKKGGKNHRVKKVIKSKNDFSKSCPKFCKLGSTKSKKMWILEPKNVFSIL